MIQPMLSPTRLAPEGPTLLLAPGDWYGALGSEGYDHAQAELVEAPSIVKIAGKYALIYSTRGYRSLDYKSGVA